MPARRSDRGTRSRPCAAAAALAGCSGRRVRRSAAPTPTASSSARPTSGPPPRSCPASCSTAAAYDVADGPRRGRGGQLLGVLVRARAGPRPTTWRRPTRPPRRRGDASSASTSRTTGTRRIAFERGPGHLPQPLRPGRQARAGLRRAAHHHPGHRRARPAGPDRRGDPAAVTAGPSCSRSSRGSPPSSPRRRLADGRDLRDVAQSGPLLLAIGVGGARRAGQLPVPVRPAAGARLPVLCDRPGRRRPGATRLQPARPRRRDGSWRAIAGVGRSRPALHRRVHRRLHRSPAWSCRRERRPRAAHPHQRTRSRSSSVCWSSCSGWPSSGCVPGLQRECRIQRLPAGRPGSARRCFGAVFALCWMPCTGPTLAAVLGLATVGGQTDRAVVLAVAYCLGLGLPFVVFGLGFRRLLGVFRAVRRNSRWVTRVGGALLILVGLALVTGGWSDFIIWLRTTVRRRRGEHLMTIVADRADPEAPPSPAQPGAGPAAQLVAAAHQHADGADPALPARRRGDPRLGAAAARRQPGEGQPVLRRPPRAGARAGPARRASRCSPRPGSPRSTCCCSSRWSAASCPGCATTSAPCAPSRRPAPKRLDRLPQHAVRTGAADATPRPIAAGAAASRRWRVRGHDGTVTVSAEKGYLKETGNLLFHFALIAVLIGVALGSWYGWHGNRLLVAGATTAFCNTRQQYDEYELGPQVDAADLPPFCLTLNRLRGAATWTIGPAEFVPAPRSHVEEAGRADPRPRPSRSTPRCASTAPTSTCSATATRRSCATPTGTARPRPQTVAVPASDGDLTSEGVAEFPDANVDPTTGKRDPNAAGRLRGALPAHRRRSRPPFTRSAFPAERNPALVLIAYRGEPGPGRRASPARSTSSTSARSTSGKLKQVGDGSCSSPARRWTLDDGTTLEFLGTKPYITLVGALRPRLDAAAGQLDGAADRPDGARCPASAAGSGSGSAGGSAADLAEAPTGGSSLVEAGGLPRTDYPGFADEFAQLVAAVSGTSRAGPVGAATRAIRPGREKEPMMAALSDQLLAVAILAYLVAMSATPPSTPSAPAPRARSRPAGASWSGAGSRRGRRAGRRAPAGRRRTAGPASAARRRRARLAGRVAVGITVLAALLHVAATGHPRHRRRPDALGQHVRVRADRLPSSARSAWLVRAVAPPGAAPARPVRHPGDGAAARLRRAGALHAEVAPLMPALQLVLVHRSTSRRSPSRPGIFLLGAVPAALFLCATGTTRASAASRTRWRGGCRRRRRWSG